MQKHIHLSVFIFAFSLLLVFFRGEGVVGILGVNLYLTRKFFENKTRQQDLTSILMHYLVTVNVIWDIL